MLKQSFAFCWFLIASMSVSFSRADDSPDLAAANRALGRGVNLGNFLEAPRNANWSIRIEDEDFARIKAAGFDSIRLPVKWSDYAAAAPPYDIEEAFFRRVDRLLDLAEASRLNVVLNIHHYDGLDEQPDRHAERFAALWRQIAAHYRQRPASLYFELHNEPHAQLDARWNDVLRLGLAAVRETNPDRPVIVGPIHWNSVTTLDKLALPDDKRLIVTVHYYHPFEFTHQGATWTDPRVRSIKDRRWEGTAAELGQVQKEFDAVASWSKAHGRPIFLGEFGAYQRAPLESRVRWTAAVAREAEARGFSWAYWEFAAGFGIYDRGQASWHEPLLRALIPASP